MKIDITVLTCQKYLNPEGLGAYGKNIIDERNLLINALKNLGLTVTCVAWDDPHFNWENTRAVVFRTIWDYFEKQDQFLEWLKKTQAKTQMINSYEAVLWNIDKHYLGDLSQKGIQIVPTVFADKGSNPTLASICAQKNWQDIVIKPAIAGGAYLTYKITASEREAHEKLFADLIAQRDMLVQPFVKCITTKGEASLMIFNGDYTHAIIKKAKTGDYRVQDDWGGTVHPYVPSQAEIDFAIRCFKACSPMPAYGRADILWDEQGNIMLGELEII